MQTTVWKSVPVLRNPLCLPPHFVAFHSTPISLTKCNDKTSIRYTVRQNRPDARSALKNFLLYGKSSKPPSQVEDLHSRANKVSNRKAKVKNSSPVLGSHPQSQCPGNSKPHGTPFSEKGKHCGSKRWKNKQNLYNEDSCGPHETIFQRGGFTWTSTSWENSYFDNSKTGFGRRDESRYKNAQKVWGESDVDDDQPDVGLRSHRVTLGLPPIGPLKLDDVKYAFRASALKWHPDKHQGPTQAKAEEKFKLCTEAYNSICTALRSA